MTVLRGIPVSAGFAMSRAFIFNEIESPIIPHYAVSAEEAPAQWRRFEEAIEARAALLQTQLNALSPDTEKTQFDILTVHLLMLNDPDFIDQVKDRLFNQQQNIEWAVWEVAQAMTKKLQECENPMLRERAVDITDMGNSLIKRLLSIAEISLADLTEDAIIVTRDLMPSEAMAMNRACVKGVVMAAGSYTSHSAILARAFGIPAVAGLSGDLKAIKPDDLISIDGVSGEVVVNPSKPKQTNIRRAMEEHLSKRRELLTLRDQKAQTRDGREIILKANIQIPEEIEAALDYGADGVGLFRSEFLFLTPGEPVEEAQQTAIYTKLVKAARNTSVTIRTCDVGGDKVLPNFYPREDKNPLLGWRAIRFSLAVPEVFKAQLRAILRASAHGSLRLMFPMISVESELDTALRFVEECKDELRAAGTAFNEQIAVGTMIEVPSAALIAGRLARKCAFFSIGTNDLMQYAFAIDRGNERVSHLADPRHPAFLSLIKMTCDAAERAGIPASVCGEAGGDPNLTPLLLGLGVTELSMNASQIPEVKKMIRSLNVTDCVKRVNDILGG